MKQLLLLSTKTKGSPEAQLYTKNEHGGMCRLYDFEAVFDIHGDIHKHGVADRGQDDLILPR